MVLSHVIWYVFCFAQKPAAVFTLLCVLLCQHSAHFQLLCPQNSALNIKKLFFATVRHDASAAAYLAEGTAVPFVKQQPGAKLVKLQQFQQDWAEGEPSFREKSVQQFKLGQLGALDSQKPQSQRRSRKKTGKALRFQDACQCVVCSLEPVCEYVL